ncbi:MAG: hypothetical protein NC548_11275 [Lachnospiraceae bacterium]|nr:hypothetical protein [Lachnospiraceae bacterium]
MKLVIQKDYAVSKDLDTMILSARMLLEVSVHLYISSHKWDSITIEICDDIPDDVLQYIRMQTDNKYVRLPEKLNERQLKMLVSLYPELAGKIRRAYMSGVSLREVVPICTE